VINCYIKIQILLNKCGHPRYIPADWSLLGCEDSFEKSKDKSGSIAACQSGCEFQTSKTKPEIAVAKPEVIKPKPEIAAAKPEVVKSKPEMAEDKPEVDPKEADEEQVGFPFITFEVNLSRCG